MDAYGQLSKLISSEASSSEGVSRLRAQCYDALNDDLNSPVVIALLFEAVRIVYSAKDGKITLSANDLKELQELFQLFLFDILGMKNEAQPNSNRREEAFGKAIELLLSIRQKSKAQKDWATSDQIRNELTALGFEIKDTKEGTEWKIDI